MTAATRRQLLAGAATAALATGPAKMLRAATPVAIGYISPETGPLAPFGEADAFVINALKPQLESHGINIELRDSESDPDRAASVANELIDNDVAMILVSSTPETTNPVSDQCELAGVPCLSTVAPWQAWFYNRGGDPAVGFDYTYHFFWGLEDVIAAYTGMWNQVSTNRVVGGLFPNDGDGSAWSDTGRGFPPALSAANFNLVNPGSFNDLSSDFSSQINAFKAAKADIITGVVIPPDFTTFWTQAKQQGLTPKVASVGKALLFPETLNALGDGGNNLSTEVWWTPSHPFTSSLTNQTAADLTDAYTKATSKQWTQPIGFAHALIELAVDIIGRATDPTDHEKILAALISTNLKTIVGPISWANGPVKNVCKTPLVGGQWRRTPQGPFQYNLIVTENAEALEIPLGGKMEPMG